MKNKILISIIIILICYICCLLLCGCSQKMFTPVLNTEFNAKAVYKTGGFSYSCEIISDKTGVTVIPTSTSAKGLKIKYDGKTVEFSKNDFSKSYKGNDIDLTNPSKVIYSVLDYLKNTETLEISRVDSTFQYAGKTNLGAFVLIQNDDNSIKSISIPNANIYIEFESEK